jgi:calcineurin-like phosphoesterase family protein
LEQYFGQDVGFLADTFLPPSVKDASSILVLAGDISSKQAQLQAFLEIIEHRFLKVLFLCGNHEWYGHDMSAYAPVLESMPLKNTEVAALTVKCYVHDNVRIIFGTLWADGGATLADRSAVGRYLRDFYVIRKKDQLRWTVPDMAEAFKVQKAAIVDRLKQPFEGVTIVATHHMPSLRLCHPRFGNEANGGFASNCDDILAYDHAPNVWIHGHTHDTIDTKLWKTRIVCNPSVYHQESGSAYKTYVPTFIDLENVEG